MRRLRAIIFDVDGTLAETEEAHRTAFNRAFAEAGLTWRWNEDDYRALLATTGGRERIARYMDEQRIAADAAMVGALHVRKNALYAELVAAGAVTPRPGVVPLIEEARHRGIPLGIATTTSRANLTALLHHAFGAGALGWFSAIVVGEDVAAKKPDPAAYRLVLARLSLDPAGCVAIEDSRNGLVAGMEAGIPVVVTPSWYLRGDCFEGAALIVPSLAGVDLAALEALLF